MSVGALHIAGINYIIFYSRATRVISLNLVSKVVHCADNLVAL